MTALDDARALANHASEVCRLSALAYRLDDLDAHARALHYITFVSAYWRRRNEAKLADAFARIAQVHRGHLRMHCHFTPGHA